MSDQLPGWQHYPFQPKIKTNARLHASHRIACRWLSPTAFLEQSTTNRILPCIAPVRNIACKPVKQKIKLPPEPSKQTQQDRLSLEAPRRGARLAAASCWIMHKARAPRPSARSKLCDCTSLMPACAWNSKTLHERLPNKPFRHGSTLTEHRAVRGLHSVKSKHRQLHTGLSARKPKSVSRNDVVRNHMAHLKAVNISTLGKVIVCSHVTFCKRGRFCSHGCICRHCCFGRSSSLTPPTGTRGKQGLDELYHIRVASIPCEVSALHKLVCSSR